VNAAGLLFDPWVVLLAVGIAASFVCTLVMITGISPTRRTSRPSEISQRAPLPTASASAIRERAAARADAAVASSRVHVLTDLRIAGEVVGRPAGHEPRVGDGHRGPYAVTGDDAHAIVAQFVEHDPRRIAEVITEWIRADIQRPKPESS